MDTVPCLTICQPWAWAILAGLKRFENRTWYTDYTGPVVIHAGKSDGWMDRGMAFLGEHGCRPLVSELAFGAVLGLVDMIDCVRPGAAYREATCGTQREHDPFAVGPWCHVYANPRRLATPVPYKGQQAFFKVPRSIVAELLGDEIERPAPDAGATPPAETREQKIDRAIAAVGGSGRLRRIEQRDLW